eukprot:SAG31_NODE_170_length_21415_cov_8.230813_4_plen_173_part_00
MDYFSSHSEMLTHSTWHGKHKLIRTAVISRREYSYRFMPPNEATIAPRPVTDDTPASERPWHLAGTISAAAVFRKASRLPTAAANTMAKPTCTPAQLPEHWSEKAAAPDTAATAHAAPAADDAPRKALCTLGANAIEMIEASDAASRSYIHSAGKAQIYREIAVPQVSRCRK